MGECCLHRLMGLVAMLTWAKQSKQYWLSEQTPNDLAVFVLYDDKPGDQAKCKLVQICRLFFFLFYFILGQIANLWVLEKIVHT